jgi:hypothetical protein
LKLKFDELLGTVAFKHNLRRYIMVSSCRSVDGPDLLYQSYTSTAADALCTRARRVGAGGKQLELSWVGSDFGSSAAAGSCGELEQAGPYAHPLCSSTYAYTYRAHLSFYPLDSVSA